MWLALHGFHIAMIVLGGIVVCLLIQPRRPGEARRVAELRAAGTPDAIRALAEARAHATAVEPAPRSNRQRRITRGLGFGAMAVGLGSVAHRLAEGAWPPLWLLASALAVICGAGYYAYARTRRPWQWAVLVTGSQLVLNAAFSAAAILLAPGGASTADWARVLFCYHAGAAPTAAQVTAARNALGPGASNLLPSHSGGAGGVLLWAALAHFVAAAALAVYVMCGEAVKAMASASNSTERRRASVAGDWWTTITSSA